MQKEESINLISIFHNFYRYKKSVLIILILTLLATSFYIKSITPIYSSYVLIDINVDSKSSMNSLFSNNEYSTQNKESLVNHEIKVLKSRNIIYKILESIDLSKKIFIKNKWKNEELYRDEIPFQIEFINKNKTIKNYTFSIEAIDKSSFYLTVQNNQEERKKRYRYSQNIETKNYKIKIYKKKFQVSLINSKYIVKINTDKSNLISHILNNLSVGKEVDSILSIRYEDTIPERAKDTLNQLILTYKKNHLKVRQMKYTKNIAFLDKRITEVKKRLKKIGNRLKQYKIKHTELLIVGSEDRVFANNIDKNHQLSRLLLKLKALKTTKEHIQGAIYSSSILENSNLQTTHINQLIYKLSKKSKELELFYQQQNNTDTLLIKNELYVTNLTNLTKSKSELEELRLEYTDEYPSIKKIKANIYQIQNELNRYLQKNIIQYTNEVINLKSEIYKTINTLIASINNEYASVQSSLKADALKIEKLPALKIGLEELTQTFEVNTNNYEKLLQKRSESLIAKESTISNIQVMDSPSNPRSPIKPKKSFLYLSGLILGFTLAILYSSIQVRRDKTIYNKYDIPQKNYQIVSEEDNNKSYWRLITTLERINPLDKSQVILISSNDYAENKTSTLYDLSNRLSRISKKILIIDFDVYNPNLTKNLNQKPPLGLSSILTSKHPILELHLRNYIKTINQDDNYLNIDILPSGPILPNGTALLFSSKISDLIETLSKQYDYILIDTPPIGKYPEISILLNYIHTLLVVVKMHKTDKSIFEKLSKIEEKEIKKIIFLT